MAKFKIAHKRTGGFEGGYVNDPDDRGGETAFGIARVYNPNWDGWLIIDRLKKTHASFKVLKEVIDNHPQLILLAEKLYEKKYFSPLRLHQVNQAIANELYDSSVNLGQGAAGKSFQRALNILNRNQKDYPDITVDGAIGQMTISSYDSLMDTARFRSRNKEKLTRWLIKWINFFQMQVYYKHDGTAQEKFMPGWTDRV